MAVMSRKALGDGGVAASVGDESSYAPSHQSEPPSRQSRVCSRVSAVLVRSSASHMRLALAGTPVEAKRAAFGCCRSKKPAEQPAT